MSYLLTPGGVQLRRRVRADLLEVNRAMAFWLGFDRRYTLSSNIAIAIAKRTGMPFADAKRLFHGGLAGCVAVLLGQSGLAKMPALGFAAATFAWLESFDSSAHLR